MTEGSRSAPDDRFALGVDAAAVFGYVFLGGGTLLLDGIHGPGRVLLAAPLFVFLPGYAILSALAPASDGVDHSVTSTTRLRRRGLSWFERCTLSIAGSLALLPLVGVSMAAANVAYTTQNVLVVLLSVVVAGFAVGLVRRTGLPAETRYAPPVNRWRTEARGAFFDTTRGDAALNVVLVIVVVAAMTGFAYGLAAPPRDESYTEAAILNDDNGSLVTGNYTQTVRQGQPFDFILSVENEEGIAENYTAVVVLERVRDTGDGLVVLERNELARTSDAVADGETWREPMSVTPQLLGRNLRLDVLIYRGDAPATATRRTADQHLTLWVTVT